MTGENDLTPEQIAELDGALGRLKDGVKTYEQVVERQRIAQEVIDSYRQMRDVEIELGIFPSETAQKNEAVYRHACAYLGVKWAMPSGSTSGKQSGFS